MIGADRDISTRRPGHSDISGPLTTSCFRLVSALNVMVVRPIVVQVQCHACVSKHRAPFLAVWCGKTCMIKAPASGCSEDPTGIHRGISKY